jgi:hypothetical protein
MCFIKDTIEFFVVEISNSIDEDEYNFDWEGIIAFHHFNLNKYKEL